MASIVRFGLAALLAATGLIFTLAFDSTAGIAVGVGLLALGLVAIMSLVFYEIGLSEDRDLERRARASRRASPHERRRLRSTLRRRRDSAEDERE